MKNGVFGGSEEGMNDFGGKGDLDTSHLNESGMIYSRKSRLMARFMHELFSEDFSLSPLATHSRAT